jgi:CO/xanthine dehydrogenase Mo-binding subunit
VVRDRRAAGLAISPGQVEGVQRATSELPADPGVGGSRVTVGMAAALIRAAQAWRDRTGDGPVLAGTGADGTGADGTGADGTNQADGADAAPAVVSYCAQAATVAVDPGTGQVAVLDLTTAVDVGRIVSPRAHQMQIDGGAVMGYGFACLEDLLEEDGQLMAANLGEFKIPSAADIPPLRTVLVTGGQGVTSAGVKPVGELANVPVAAAVANAVAAATGCRIRDLPVTAEQVYWALRGEAPAAEVQRP